MASEALAGVASELKSQVRGLKLAASAEANVTVYGPPAEPATVALPEPTVDRPWRAVWTVAAAALYARPAVVWPR